MDLAGNIKFQYITTVHNEVYEELVSKVSPGNAVPSNYLSDVSKYAFDLFTESGVVDESFSLFSLKSRRDNQQPALFFSKTAKKKNAISVCKYAQCAGWWLGGDTAYTDEILLKDFDRLLDLPFLTEDAIDNMYTDGHFVKIGSGGKSAAEEVFDVPIADNAIRAIMYAALKHWMNGDGSITVEVPKEHMYHYNSYVINAIKKIYSYFPVQLRFETGFSSYSNLNLGTNNSRICIYFVPAAHSSGTTIRLDGSSISAYDTVGCKTVFPEINSLVEHIVAISNDELRFEFISKLYNLCEAKKNLEVTYPAYLSIGKSLQVFDSSSDREKVSFAVKFLDNSQRNDSLSDFNKELIKAIKPEALEEYLLSGISFDKSITNAVPLLKNAVSVGDFIGFTVPYCHRSQTLVRLFKECPDANDVKRNCLLDNKHIFERLLGEEDYSASVNNYSEKRYNDIVASCEATISSLPSDRAFDVYDTIIAARSAINTEFSRGMTAENKDLYFSRFDNEYLPKLQSASQSMLDSLSSRTVAESDHQAFLGTLAKLNDICVSFGFSDLSETAAVVRQEKNSEYVEKAFSRIKSEYESDHDYGRLDKQLTELLQFSARSDIPSDYISEYQTHIRDDVGSSEGQLREFLSSILSNSYFEAQIALSEMSGKLKPDHFAQAQNAVQNKRKNDVLSYCEEFKQWSGNELTQRAAGMTQISSVIFRDMELLCSETPDLDSLMYTYKSLPIDTILAKLYVILVRNGWSPNGEVRFKFNNKSYSLNSFAGIEAKSLISRFKTLCYNNIPVKECRKLISKGRLYSNSVDEYVELFSDSELYPIDLVYEACASDNRIIREAANTVYEQSPPIYAPEGEPPDGGLSTKKLIIILTSVFIAFAVIVVVLLKALGYIGTSKDTDDGRRNEDYKTTESSEQNEERPGLADFLPVVDPEQEEDTEEEAPDDVTDKNDEEKQTSEGPGRAPADEEPSPTGGGNSPAPSGGGEPASPVDEGGGEPTPPVDEGGGEPTPPVDEGGDKEPTPPVDEGSEAPTPPVNEGGE